jgi:predicted Zn finger-like uncharacterized protein
MFSRCPYCHSQQTVSTRQLRRNRGLLKCSVCKQRFDALVTLSDRPDAKKEQSKTGKFLFLSQSKTQHLQIWRVGSFLMLLLLIAQIAYFEADYLRRQPQLRFALLQVCELLNCQLPVYQNLEDWTVSHSGLTEQTDHQYVLTAAMTNEAEFPQAFPDLKLTLMNFNGQTIAERIFTAAQYTSATDHLLAASDTREIRLNFDVPADKVGGFTITLL